MAQYLVLVQQQRKLSAKARWGIFLGVADGHKAWRFLDVNTEGFVVARDAVFYDSLTFNSWLQAYCDAGVQLYNYCTTGFVITFWWSCGGVEVRAPDAY